MYPAPPIPAEYPPSELDPTLYKAGLKKELGDDVAGAVGGNVPHRAEAGAPNEEGDEKGEVDDNNVDT